MTLPESRLPSLYRDFRPLEELNSEGYNANISTWKKYIVDSYLEKSDDVIFPIGNSILQKLHNQVYGVPKCIDIVIDALVVEGYLIIKSDFDNGIMDGNQSRGLFSWISDKFKFSKSFTSRKNEDQTNYLVETNLIIRSVLLKKNEIVLENIKNNILQRCSGLSDLVYSREDFCKKSAISENFKVDEYDIEMSFLSKYKHLILFTGNIVKLIDPEVINIWKKFPSEITENDVRIAEVKIGINKLSQRITQMETRISNSIMKIKNGNLSKEAQREQMKTKLISDRYLTKLLQYLNNLLEIKHQIDISATSALLIQTLSNSNKAIKSLNEYSGSVEEFDQLLDDIQNQKIKTDEVSEALSSVGLTTESENEEELDKELAKLEIETIKERRNKFEEQEVSEELLDRLSHLELKDNEESKFSKTPTKVDSNKQLIAEYE